MDKDHEQVKKIAELLKMTVEEVFSTMSSEEFSRWIVLSSDKRGGRKTLPDGRKLSDARTILTLDEDCNLVETGAIA